MSHSKIMSLWKGGGMIMKKLRKGDTGGGVGGATKKVMPLTQNLLFPFFLQLAFGSFVSHEALTILGSYQFRLCQLSI